MAVFRGAIQLNEVTVTEPRPDPWHGGGGSYLNCEDLNYNGICDKDETMDCYDYDWDGICDEEEYGGGGGSDSDKDVDVDDDKITNELTGKAKCVYDKLNSSSTNFKAMIKKFDGDFPVSHLRFNESASLSSKINAKTSPPLNHLITITLNSNNLNRPNLSIARTIIHEVIHAEMFRKILSIIDNGGDLNGLTRNQWINKLSNGDYPGIFDYYSRYGVNDMQHEQMAAHYISIISNYLRKFQPGLSQNIYDSIAWNGLKNTTAWDSLPYSKKAEIKNTIKKFKARGSENCN